MARILVIEDDPSMNTILVDTLRDQDHEVTSAIDGQQAVEIAEKEQFDLVITDVRLPGMDGVETLTKIKKLQSKVRCIVITGYASEDTPIRAIRLGVDDYLFKPFSLRYFHGAVERVLKSELEKKKKWSLFQKVFSILGPSKDRELEALVLQRQDAFQGLYVGSRSGYLSLKAAAEVYTKLEILESKFRALVNAKEYDSHRMREVRGRYRDLQNRLSDYESGEGEEPPNETLVPMEDFSKLYDAIKESRIGVDELQYAPLLRTTPDERFDTLSEMLALKAILWTKPASK